MRQSKRIQCLRQLSSCILVVVTLITGKDSVQIEQIIVAEQQGRVLRCSIESDGLLWLKDSIRITENDKYTGPDTMRISLDNQYSPDFNIIISHVLKTDAGVYECKEMTTGKIMRAYEILLKSKAVIKQYSGDTVNVKEHSNPKLWCNATGLPEPDVVWFMKDEENNRIPLGINGSLLEIRDVTRDCVSIYTCSASNALNNGKPAEKDIRVNVNYGPDIDIDLYNTKVCHDSENQIDIEDSTELCLSEGDTVSLVCSVTTDQKADIKWTKDMRELARLRMDDTIERINDSNFEFQSCDPLYINEQRFMLTLRVEDPIAFGNYSCFAENDMRADEWFILLKNKEDNKC